MDFTELYYEEAFGCYPFESDEPKEKTQKTMDYLQDNLLPEREIVKFIESAARRQDHYLLPTDAYEHEAFWKGSLLEPDVFYYHPLLQLRSKAPTFNPVTGETNEAPFFLEMKIRYEKGALLHHIRKELRLPVELQDDVRDLGAVDYLLEKYRKVGIVPTIDFILFLVDEAKTREQRILSILNLSQVEQEVFISCQKMVPEMTAKKTNRIVWR